MGNDGDRRRNETVRGSTPQGFTALRSGTRLDNRYTIESVLAAGGFGITYVARHDGLGRRFAIKEHFPRQFAVRDQTTAAVHPTDPGTYHWALDRFLQEGRALARCKHPNVVDVTDVFEANSTAYMVLEYEDGQSLKSWRDHLGRPPTQAELDALLDPLLGALDFIHAQELLHRDIAPDNVMVRRDGKPCLIDFGAARQAIAQRSQVMSAIIKTGYSPPEQYTTTGRAQGPWSDIYALGATLYWLISGKVPEEATDRQIDDELAPVGDVVADRAAYRAGFLAGIDRALRLRQRERPQNIAEWRELLAADEAPAAAPPVPPTAPGEGPPRPRIDPAVAAAPTVAQSARPASFSTLAGAPPSPPSGGIPALAWAGGAVALVAAIAVGLWLLRPARERPEVIVAAAEKSKQVAVVEGQRQAATAEAERQRAAEAEKARAAAAQREAEARRKAEAEAEQQRLAAARKAAEAAPIAQAERASSTAAQPDLSQWLAPLLDKDKGRFARLVESREKGLSRAVANAGDNAKSKAAIAAARALIAVPAVPLNPAQLIGRWRCRAIELGGNLGDGNPEFAASIGSTFECRISKDGNGLVFNKVTGSIKKLGRLVPLPNNQLLYYGVGIAQDDKQPVYPAGDPYGHEVGVIEQLGPDRLRMELPELNAYGSAWHEVIELTKVK